MKLYSSIKRKRLGGRESGWEGGRAGGREGERVRGRESGREGEREGGRESGREGGRAGGREGGREGGRAGGREGERAGGREGRWEGERKQLRADEILMCTAEFLWALASLSYYSIDTCDILFCFHYRSCKRRSCMYSE